MTLQPEQLGGKENSEVDAPQLSALQEYLLGNIATATTLHFVGRRPYSTRDPLVQASIIAMLRSTPEPTMAQDWRANVSCGDEPDQFFPNFRDPDARSNATITTESHCKPCPSRGDCALAIARKPDENGIWAGLAPDDRTSVEYEELTLALLADYARRSLPQPQQPAQA